jgi:hypothetical protein
VGRTARFLSLCSILSLATAAPTSAEWHLAPLAGLTFGGKTTIVDLFQGAGNVHWHFGGAATLIGAGPIGVEALFVLTPSFFEQDLEGISLDPGFIQVTNSRVLALMGNIVIAAPRGWNEYGLRPFLSGGLGLIRTSGTDTLNVFPLRQNGLGYNLGGGAVGFLTDRTGLRFDLRYFRMNPKDNPIPISFEKVRLSYWTGSVGLVFRFQ